MISCIFCSIVNGSITSKILYEDDEFIVIEDINPKAPIHLLIITKQHIRSVFDIPDGKDYLMEKINILAKKLYINNSLSAYSLCTNVGEKAGQVIFHLHIHFLGYK